MGGRTINVLNVAEKPSVAKFVANLPSRNQGLRVIDGRSRYNKKFEFNYAIQGQPCHMLVTSVTGHLMELAFDQRYRKWHSCDPAELFRAPVHKFVPEEIDLCIVASFTRFQTMLMRDAFIIDTATYDRNLVLSSLHLDLLWNGIGRYKRMNQKSFGQSIVLINQMKALLILVGCKL